jgi:diguanylate cyclase (GGDEF)-like protein
MPGKVYNEYKGIMETIANKVRILVEKSRISRSSNTVKVTVSIGATLANPEDTIDTLFERADKLMYLSKSAGRNRVTLKEVM